MRDYIIQILDHFQLSHAPTYVNLALLLATIVVGLGANEVVRYVLANLWRIYVTHGHHIHVDPRLARRTIRRLSALTLPCLLQAMSPLLFDANPALHRILEVGIGLFLLITVTRVVSVLLSVMESVLALRESSGRLPLRSMVQMAKLFVVLIAIVLAVSVAFDKSPLYILSGLGALTAVLLLVFKDPLLGFVGGLQLSANDMVRPGDWIEMPKYGADGDVIEVGLTTVKIRNWDKTISTIPTYALVTDAFKNWRGMTESGGRRIKRAVYIDIQSVRFLTDDEVAGLTELTVLRPYLQQKQAELQEDARQRSQEAAINRRRLTNVGTFRAYLERYLRQHPLVNMEMTLLVRQLPSEPQGLPIEVYVFCRDTRWSNFEAFQADLFDHIFAILPQFGLRAFQNPSGYDLRALHEAPSAEPRQRSDN